MSEPGRSERKEAIRAFKERKVPKGVFAVRCAASGRVWVGAAPNLDAVKNRFWFCLRNGSHPNRALQEEWAAHGEAAFACEVLEKLDDDESPLNLRDTLEEKRRSWVARLGARAV